MERGPGIATGWTESQWGSAAERRGILWRWRGPSGLRWVWRNGRGPHLEVEPDILECKVKWVLGSITINKASGGDGIPVELFQILKDDAVKVHQVQSLGQEDPLEEGMATHSSISAWRTPWTQEPGGLQFIGLQRVRLD